MNKHITSKISPWHTAETDCWLPPRRRKRKNWRMKIKQHKPTGSILRLVKVSQLQIQSRRPLHRQPPCSRFFFCPRFHCNTDIQHLRCTIAQTHNCQSKATHRDNCGSPYVAFLSQRLSGLHRSLQEIFLWRENSSGLDHQLVQSWCKLP